ncbi:MAG: hypothetical protein RLO18_08405, partial [Gimesia chilikensis]
MGRIQVSGFRYPRKRIAWHLIITRMRNSMAQWWQYILDLISGGPQASIIETVLRGALIFCILFVTIDWLTLWGTRWGNRHSMSKSFYLSLLIHFCLGLGWVTVVENSPAQPEPIVKSDPIAIR